MALLLLLAAGALFALLYILIGLVRAIRGSERIGFLDTLLVFLTTLVLLAALIANRMEAQPLPMIEGAVIGIAVVVIVLSVIIALIEYRRPQRLRQSRGVFGIGAAILVLISVFSVPIVADSFAVATATPPVETEEAGSDTRIATPTVRPTTPAPTTQPSPTNTPAPTFTLTPLPTATETRLPTATPTLTPTLVECQIIADYNVNLRAAPEADAELLVTIPFNTVVTGLARNEDATWWLVSYEEQTGWVDNQFVTADFLCGLLPVR